MGALLRASDGMVYGTTRTGGDLSQSGSPAAADGTIFRMGFPMSVVLEVEKAPLGFRILVRGRVGVTYTIETSPTMPPAWTDLGKVTNQTSVAEFMDARSGKERAFYRAR